MILAALMFAGTLLLSAACLYAFRSVLESPALTRTNYRGKAVPTGAGVIFAPVFLVSWSFIFALSAWPVARVSNSLVLGMDAMLVLVLGMCLAGFVDDVAGDREQRGFKGHFSSALKGRFTTGFLKALVGFVAALAAAAVVTFTVPGSRSAYGEWVLNAAVIALAANFFNLLDVMPGRAMKVFVPAEVLALFLTWRYWFAWRDMLHIPEAVVTHELYVIPGLCVLAAALALAPGDLRERFMLGDAGSNVMGAAVGLGLVIGTNFWWRLGVLALLLALNLLSEKFSFSRAIASNRALNWVDSLGRKG